MKFDFTVDEEREWLNPSLEKKLKARTAEGRCLVRVFGLCLP